MHACDFLLTVAVDAGSHHGLVDALPLGDVLLEDDRANRVRLVKVQGDGVALVLAGCLDATRAEVSDLLAQAGQDLDVGVREETIAVRRNVEEEGGITADLALPDREQLLDAAYLGIFDVVVEPALAGRGVDLGGVPGEGTGVVGQRLA